MPSLASILVALSLPLYALSAHHGNHAHRHVDLALRSRGDVLQKRDFTGSFTWYDITAGLYVRSSALRMPSMPLIISLQYGLWRLLWAK